MPNKLLLHAAENKSLERMAMGSPLSRSLVKRYVAGYAFEDARDAAVALAEDGIDVSLDLLGESVQDIAQARAATQEYRDAIARLGQVVTGATVSVKLSQLGIMSHVETCSQNLLELLEAGAEHGVGVEVDMEHSSVGPDTVRAFRRHVADFPDTRLAIQACMRRTPEDLLAFGDNPPRIRLVKGAFDETADVALQDKEEVTKQYNYLAEWALANLPDPGFGTHDGECIQHVKDTAAALGLDKRSFEFQLLHGVRRPLQKQLVDEGYRVRVYLPYGTQWYPYLVRRMAERPANLLMFFRSLVSG
ncbi:proline dehydrogenase family protein [Nesterenkonia halophila]